MSKMFDVKRDYVKDQSTVWDFVVPKEYKKEISKVETDGHSITLGFKDGDRLDCYIKGEGAYKEFGDINGCIGHKLDGIRYSLRSYKGSMVDSKGNPTPFLFIVEIKTKNCGKEESFFRISLFEKSVEWAGLKGEELKDVVEVLKLDGRTIVKGARSVERAESGDFIVFEADAYNDANKFDKVIVNEDIYVITDILKRDGVYHYLAETPQALDDLNVKPSLISELKGGAYRMFESDSNIAYMIEKGKFNCSRVTRGEVNKFIGYDNGFSEFWKEVIAEL